MILTPEILFAAIVGFPFLSILLILFFKDAERGSKAGLFPVIFASVAGILLMAAHWNTPLKLVPVSWFTLGTLEWDFLFVFDAVAIMMLALISFIGMLVYAYSITYLKGQSGLKRYFIILIMFMLSMYGLVISGNLFQLFFFWELVGFCSFGLIGFYFDSEIAARAAKKAFMVNRIADVFLVIGLGLVFQQFSTLSLTEISGAGEISIWAGLFLFLGACGKSAQYPFAIWLPDAMAGPTPVSAFIHAATMVTAGILLLARIYFLMPEQVLTIIAFVGGFTALFAAIAALAQHDIKRVLAYSTISQLGYMMIGLGTGAWDASLFHLFTHAFFKAGLFLNAGAVILWLKKFKTEQGLNLDPQDLRNMGGLKKYLPVIFGSFTLCTLALVGVPFFSGYLSKDAIISGSYAWAEAKGEFFYFLIPDLAFITIILTAIYMFRILILIFMGDFKYEKYLIKKPAFKSAYVTGTSLILGILSLGFIVSINPLDIGQNWLMPGIQNTIAFNPLKEAPGIPFENHTFIASISILMIIIGAAFAWLRYRPTGTYHRSYIAHYQFDKPYQRAAFYHFYLDIAYHKAVVSPLIMFSAVMERLDRKVVDKAIEGFAVLNVIIAHFIKWIDKYIVDGIINFSAFFAGFMGRRFKSLTSGMVQGQLVSAFFVLLIILYLILF
ncbi:MAG: NADH-quinone oxidoreductase subunit 5 family protein [Candidatus Cyclobacteriaceae bacterium M2_1C_046]